MIHHKDHGGVAWDALYQCGVVCTCTHLVQRIGQEPCQTDSETEIGESAEARHDLSGISARLLKRDVFGDSFLACVVNDSLVYLWVVDQPLDHVVAAGQLERFNRAGQACVKLCNRFFQTPAKKPAYRRQQEMAKRRDGCEQHNHHK